MDEADHPVAQAAAVVAVAARVVDKEVAAVTKAAVRRAAAAEADRAAAIANENPRRAPKSSPFFGEQEYEPRCCRVACQNGRQRLFRHGITIAIPRFSSELTSQDG